MLRIIHEYLRETEDGFVLTLYLSRHSDVEFAEELGVLEDQADDELLLAYLERHHPHTPINQIQLVDGNGQIHTCTYMSLLPQRADHQTDAHNSL
ncbi:MAG TPA: hypothetical protein VFV52_04145 [Bacilli bacterium]|nr:hypothetical protein [Bacilli bacterium]